MSDVTLQINLSPGDIKYAESTVPALVEPQRAAVDEVLAVVDCCRPQRTKIVDPDARFPPEVFAQRVAEIRRIAEALRGEGWLDRVVYLTPDEEIFGHLSHRYLRGLVHETHDYGGCALMSYLAGLELPRTRFVAHFDGDLLLYQAGGFDWIAEARRLMAQHPEAVAASPRLSPPPAPGDSAADQPESVRPLAAEPIEGGWLDPWFSTRCFLIDRKRLEPFLPLPRGRLLWEILAVKLLGRGYPRSPEVMLHRRVGRGGGRRLILDSPRAWLLHPVTKPPEFLDILPQIIEAVRRGEVPDAQRARQDIDLGAWQEFLSVRQPT